MIRIAFILFMVSAICAPALGQSEKIQKRDTVFYLPDQTEINAEIGILKVPENRSTKNSRWISITFVRLKTVAAQPEYPLIYLEGGDAPCTWQVTNPSHLKNWLPYLQISDVILFDQRGTMDQDLISVWYNDYPENFMVSEQAAGNHWKIMAQEALANYPSKGIDISGYTLEESANDVFELADELNIERFSILGFSAGSTLGLTLIKLNEKRIFNAIFAGTDAPHQLFNYPSDLDNHFNKLATLVSKDPQVKDDIPDLNKLLHMVMEKLEEQPMHVEVINPLTQQPMTVKVGPFGLAFILRMDIDDATDIPVIPRLLYSIDRGDASILRWFLQKRIVYAFAVPGNGLNKAIAAGVSKERLNKIQQEAEQSPFKNVVNFPFISVLEVWPNDTMNRKTDQLVKSNVRTLFLSGEFDCRTPSSQTEEIKKGFINSTHLVVNSAGHEQILSNDTIRRAIIDFLSGQDVGHIKASYQPLNFMPVQGNDHAISHPAIKK